MADTHNRFMQDAGGYAKDAQADLDNALKTGGSLMSRRKEEKKVADEFQYIQLPDGSYGKFHAGASDDMIRSTLAKDFPELAKKSTSAPVKGATAEQQLKEDNPAWSRGGRTLVEQGGKGLKQMGEFSPGSLAGGALQTLNAPSEAIGDVVGTKVHTTLAGIPGLGGAEGVIPAGGAAIANALTQVGTGNIVSKGLVAGAKGLVKATGRITAPAATRKAGRMAAAEEMGATANPITRAFEVPASKDLYRHAEGQAPLSATDVARNLRESGAVASKSMQARPARAIIAKTADNIDPQTPIAGAGPAMKPYGGGYTPPAAPQAQPAGHITWKNAIDEAQGLRQQAHKAFINDNTVAGTTLREAADSLVHKLENAGPAYRAANKTYLREQGINTITEVMAKPGTSAKLESLFRNDPMTRAAFSRDEAKTLEKIASYMDTIGATGSPYSGKVAQFIDAALAPISGMMRSDFGLKILTKSFKETKKITPQAINSVWQVFNAYQKSDGGKGSQGNAP